MNTINMDQRTTKSVRCPVCARKACAHNKHKQKKFIDLVDGVLVRRCITYTLYRCAKCELFFSTFDGVAKWHKYSVSVKKAALDLLKYGATFEAATYQFFKKYGYKLAQTTLFDWAHDRENINGQGTVERDSGVDDVRPIVRRVCRKRARRPVGVGERCVPGHQDEGAGRPTEGRHHS